MIAGTGKAGSLGDGAAATSADFDLSTQSLSVRSGIVIGPDSTIFIADTGNSTIRTIGGAASTEPGIIRSVAGRFSSSQGVQLTEPLGIALDRAGNLYIADRAANSIDILYGQASGKAGTLERFAGVLSPSNVAVTPDGHTVFASSADTGSVVAINASTRAVRDAGIAPASYFPAALLKSSSVRVAPQGLATDGAGNLFVSYALVNSAAGSDSESSTATSSASANDQILRLDAFNAKVTVAAHGLSSPGELTLATNGDLFVSNQNSQQILKFAAMAVPSAGVTLTPPGGAGSTTDFGTVPVGGSTDSTALQEFQLSNNTASAISNVTSSFSGANAADFTISNTSCTSTLAAGASCAYNVAFTPTSGATSGCQLGGASASRCSNLSVNYSGATSPLLAAVTGTASDFEIQCVSNGSIVCLPSTAGGTVSITITAGFSATYLFQIVPDANFSGAVTLVCPGNLPASPVGTTGQPTTCGISAGTAVTEPLTTSLVVDVTAGTAVPFNVTFQTTNSKGQQTLPTSSSNSTDGNRTFALAAFAGAKNTDGPSAPHSGAASSAKRIVCYALITFFAALLLSLAAVRMISMYRTKGIASTVRVLIPSFAMFALLAAVTTFLGCHHYQNPTITSTPAGTYSLTVQGSAQNTSRGFTMTLIVQ